MKAAVLNVGCTYQPGQSIANRFVIDKLLATRPIHETYLVRGNDAQSTVQAGPLVLKSFDPKELHPVTADSSMVTGHDQENRRLFFVRPYAQGITLSDALRFWSDGLPLADVIYLLMEVALLLDDLHKQGVVHANIKPSNVLLLSGGASNHDLKKVALLDPALGSEIGSTIAKRTTRRAELAPCHIVPEQLMSLTTHVPSFSDDIFAFGLLAFELLTCRFAWSENSLGRACFLQCIGPALFPQRYREIPHTLEALINRCVKRAPEERYPHMQAIIHELRYEWIDACSDKKLFKLCTATSVQRGANT